MLLLHFLNSRRIWIAFDVLLITEIHVLIPESLFECCLCYPKIKFIIITCFTLDICSINNIWCIFSTAVTYFYSVLIKVLIEVACFWEVLFYQIKVCLTNIRFEIWRIRYIIPYYLELLLFIVIIIIIPLC